MPMYPNLESISRKPLRYHLICLNFASVSIESNFFSCLSATQIMFLAKNVTNNICLVSKAKKVIGTKSLFFQTSKLCQTLLSWLNRRPAHTGTDCPKF